ncbi:hypothetical protein [Actinoplanes sp. NPDC048796]|uniref:hypothetical protein n=1 Tax=unclassified Actinoplanes TaxID=2626549 RepID=UPI00340D81F4
MALTNVVLASGRDIDLSDIHLSSTYGGLIEGYPNARINDYIVEGLARRAGQLFPLGPVHVVTPARTESEVDPGERWPFGPPQRLQPVTCVGLFSSHPVDPELDPVLHFSRLVVAWFQDDVSLPAGDLAPAGLRQLRWDDLATDGEV